MRLSNYESGKREPDLTFLKQIVEKYGVSADWLLGLTNDREPSATPDATQRLVRVEGKHGARYVAIVKAGEKTAVPEGEYVVIRRKTDPYSRRRTVIVRPKHGSDGELEAVPVTRKAFARLARQVANQQKTLDSLTAKKRRTVKLVKV